MSTLKTEQCEQCSNYKRSSGSVWCSSCLSVFEIEHVDINDPNPYVITRLKKNVKKYLLPHNLEKSVLRDIKLNVLLPGAKPKLYIVDNIIQKIDGRQLTNFASLNLSFEYKGNKIIINNIPSNGLYYKINDNEEFIKNDNNYLLLLSTYAPITIFYVKEYTDSNFIASDFSNFQYCELTSQHNYIYNKNNIWSSNNGVWYPERIQKTH
jgi:hypothetical protein